MSVEPRLLYQDAQLVVVDKPAGLAVHPSPRWPEGTLVHWLRRHFESGRGRVQLAHRLDRETSGVVVATRDEASNQFVHRAFAQRRVEKRYLALVVGAPTWDELEVDAPIGAHPSSAVRMRMAVVPGAAASRTSLQVVGRLPGHAWVQAKPVSGRTHQIRVHLSHVGHPIVGDKIYGPDEALFIQWHEGRADDALWTRLGMPRHALHAESISLPHPWRDERLEVSTPAPPDMRRWAEGLSATR